MYKLLIHWRTCIRIGGTKNVDFHHTEKSIDTAISYSQGANRMPKNILGVRSQTDNVPGHNIKT